MAGEDKDMADAPRPQGEDAGLDVVELQELVDQNPASYDAHANLVGAYRARGMMDEARQARVAMSQAFPLPPGVWLQWVGDEESAASDVEELQQIQVIYEQAVKDYDSVDVWLRYCAWANNVAQQQGLGEEAVEAWRGVVRRAVSKMGNHHVRGAEVWDQLLALERAHGDEASVRSTYAAMLAAPLKNAAELWGAYEEWETDAAKVDMMRAVHEEAKEVVEKIKEMEYRLSVSDDVRGAGMGSHYDVWMDYFELGSSLLDEDVMCGVFERALLDCFLVPEVWLRCAEFAELTLNDKDTMEGIYERAVRNVPNSGALWAGYMRALAVPDMEQTPADLYMILIRALSGGAMSDADMNVLCVEYLDAVRAIGDRDAFEEAATKCTMPELVGERDLTMIQCFVGRALEITYHDTDAAIKWWESAISTHRTECAVWLKYLSVLRAAAARDTAHTPTCRSAFQRAAASVQDWNGPLLEAWVEWEREHGRAALPMALKSQRQDIALQQRVAAQQWKSEQLKQQQRAERQKRTRAKYGKGSAKGGKGAKGGKTATKKRKRGDEGEGSGRKAAKKAAEGDAPAANAPAAGASKRDEAEAPKAPKVPKVQVQMPKQERNLSAPPPRAEVANSKEHLVRTLHVSNLDFTVPKAKLEELFGAFGPLEEVRLVTTWKGRSKGFAYVEFKEEAHAMAAMQKMNGHDLEGRTMNVVKSTPVKQKGPRKADPCTAFVVNLSIHTSVDAVKQLFAQFGNVKEVRLPVDKMGKLKGFAYVEFDSPDSARAAIDKHKQLVLEGRILSVQPSLRRVDGTKPPKTEEDASASRPFKPAFGTQRRRGRLALLPRALRKKK